MEFSAQQIAEVLGGKVKGDINAMVSNVSKIEEGVPGTVSFLSNPKYEKYIYSTNASVVIVNKTFKPAKDITSTLVMVDDAYESFATLLSFYDEHLRNKEEISSLAFVEKTTDISNVKYLGQFAYVGKDVVFGKNVQIYPQVYIGDNVKIGDNVVLYPGAKVYHACNIGNNCVLHAGVVIGADGFGFAPQKDGEYAKIPQVGNVIIEDNVEVGSNTTIDRATFGSTIIRKGAKIDNLIQIAHNVEVGNRTIVAAQSGISGSTKVGNDTVLAGQVGLAGHINIGNNVKIAAQSGIGADIADNQIVQGSPGYNVREYQKSYIYFKRLPQTDKRISDLEKELKELKELLKK